jgi:glycosyltransferase involved in cell wall biosynthesis
MPGRRRISFLVPDIGAPSVGAAVRLAGNIARDFDTEIVGPDLGTGVCPMYRDAYPFNVVSTPRIYRLPDYWRETRKLRAAITGDLVVAVKAFADTVPVALKCKAERGVPCAVYLDEWDGFLYHGLRRMQKALQFARHIHHPLESIYHPWVESLIPKADTVISSTRFLQRKFGGHVVHMGVDCDWFRPQPPEEVAALKKRLGLADKRLLVFGGVVRPHKGVEQILEALRRIGDDRLRLLVAGPVTDHLAALLKHPAYGAFLQCAGAPPGDGSSVNWEVHQQMPLYLDLADLIVLPQMDTVLAQSQMPIKIFEAMAMAKPIIASRVSDLPEMLEGCGCIVEPDNVTQLMERIRHLLLHPEEAGNLGRAAREKCLRCYSRERSSSDLQTIFGALLEQGAD